MREISVAATMDYHDEVIAFVEEQLEELDCPMKIQLQFSIAVDELFSNIVLYAYPPREGMVTIRVEQISSPKAIAVTFVDQGTPYNPLEREDPDVTLSAEDRPIGGLGFFMVKKTMDEVLYTYREGSNVLSIRKNLPG